MRLAFNEGLSSSCFNKPDSWPCVGLIAKHKDSETGWLSAGGVPGVFDAAWLPSGSGKEPLLPDPLLTHSKVLPVLCCLLKLQERCSLKIFFFLGISFAGKVGPR